MVVPNEILLHSKVVVYAQRSLSWSASANSYHHWFFYNSTIEVDRTWTTLNCRLSLRKSYIPRLKLHLQNSQCDKSVAPTSRACCLRHDGATERSNATVDGDEGVLQLGCPLRMGGGWWRREIKLLSVDRGWPMGGLRNATIFVDTMSGIPRVCTEDFWRAQLQTSILDGLTDCELIKQ